MLPLRHCQTYPAIQRYHAVGPPEIYVYVYLQMKQDMYEKENFISILNGWMDVHLLASANRRNSYPEIWKEDHGKSRGKMKRENQKFMHPRNIFGLRSTTLFKRYVYQIHNSL